MAQLGASWVAGSGVLAGGATAPGGPPCPSSACYLASAPQGPGWDLPQVGGRGGEQRPRCVGEGSEWGQLLLRPGPALAPDVRGIVSRPPRLSCQIHNRTGQVSSARTTVSTSGRSPSKPDMLPTAPGQATGALGSASCHPPKQLWSWLVRGKPSRKHHQL